MPPAEVTTWLNFLLGPFGTTVLLAFLGWAFYTEKLVSGIAHKRVREERDAALRRLDRAVSVSGRAVDLVDTKEK